MKTTAGPVTLARPKLRGTTAAFASRLFGTHVTKTNALETLVIASFVRGLSVRDVEAALAEALGDQAAISKSTVQRGMQGRSRTSTTRGPAADLTASCWTTCSWTPPSSGCTPASPAEPVLAAWGITTAGKPVFIGLAPGSGESTDAWADFLPDLQDRGLRPPAAGHLRRRAGPDRRDRAGLPLRTTPEMSDPSSCATSSQGPAGMQAEIKRRLLGRLRHREPEDRARARLVELIDHRLTSSSTATGATYPAAMKCLRHRPRAGLTAYLRFPPEHHQRIRHSNFIERTFGETRRRAKVIGRFPGETSCVSLVWAVLDRASRGWRGLTMTAAGLRLLQDLRRSLLDPPRRLRPRHTGTCLPADQPETVTATA